MARTNRRDQIPLADFERPGMLEPVLCHAVSRCVRGIRLLAEGGPAGSGSCPREACSDRLAAMSGSYAVEVVGHAFMENHLHGLLRVDPQLAAMWSPLEVVRRWLALHPVRSWSRKSEAEQAAASAALAADADWVREHRGRLCSVSWFMKDLKQHVAVWINRRDGQSGAVFQNRFGLSLIADEASAVAVLAYIDINTFAAGLGVEPLDGCFTSLETRVETHRDQSPGTSGYTPPTSEGAASAPRQEAKRRRVIGVRRWQGEAIFGVGGNRRSDGSGGLRANLRSGALKLWLSFGDYLRFLERYARRVREGKRRLVGDARTVLAALAEELDLLHPAVWPGPG